MMFVVCHKYRLRDNDDVKLIRGWHKHFSTILLLELFVCLVDRCEGGSTNAGDDTQSARPASRNIRRMMFNLNESPGGSNEGFNYGVDSESLQGMLPEEFESHEGSAAGDPMTEPFHLDPDQDDGGDEVEEELNSLRISQVSLAQPAISQLYEYPDHFSTLNLDVMNSDVWLGQGGPDDDPTAEFEVGQQFENKEEVLMAVKTYSIRRAVQFKILESDQLKYAVRCAEFGKGCHTAASKKNGRLGDTMALIHACKHQWGKITNGWTRRLLLVRFSQWSKQIQPSV
ncbi:hypothetical protein PIB30_069593 [Stylosanthes scabra]|uniref:Transposase MuDR plant domain-containing protein n=1 Tax=Stylosanthes scabra TaxID=79078 RepID=A0ABU6XPL1_9FABA|nr:hypothetical protein [Stylosanthes scabra]